MIDNNFAQIWLNINKPPITNFHISHAIWLLLKPLPPLGMCGKWHEYNFGENCQCEFEATQQKAFIYPTYLS